MELAIRPWGEARDGRIPGVIEPIAGPAPGNRLGRCICRDHRPHFLHDSSGGKGGEGSTPEQQSVERNEAARAQTAG